MHPINDIDATLLLATSLASKRRPAELAEIIAAADLIQGVIPFESKLSNAFFHLAIHGLIREGDGCFALTAAAQQIVADLPTKVELDERIAELKKKLAAYTPQGEHVPIRLTPGQFKSALASHLAAATEAGPNVLMPKPKADRHFKVGGKWRRSPTSRARNA